MKLRISPIARVERLPAITFEFGGAHAADPGQCGQVVRQVLGDRAQGGVVEDHVGRDVLLARQLRTQRAQGLEAREQLRREVGGGNGNLAAALAFVSYGRTLGVAARFDALLLYAFWISLGDKSSFGAAFLEDHDG